MSVAALPSSYPDLPAHSVEAVARTRVLLSIQDRGRVDGLSNTSNPRVNEYGYDPWAR
jgi:hypothetical protein